ncbi:isoprenyl transferase [Lysinibacillus alkalisoli]|uniref:Isoprenyl transferase n=1 Tax=Lysinibacillus alkalisoli TaxID=1911548 RepID=A0A917G4A0_9BACI|nr:isoprenyl transferase [Lysinibacillus alkalisoli]GGG22035.1 isoprenyl transferase [Lysinibacillus alkalisoli]
MFKNFLNKQVNIAQPIEARKEQVKRESVPSHIAIIMDGNGRWAKKRALPRIAGHREGMKNVKKITRCASDIGVEVLTVYAFSTENWKRPKEEVDFLMRLPVDFLDTFLPELIERNVRVEMIGEPDVLPKHTQGALFEAMERTKHNTGLILNFALNYGSRDEMVRAMKAVMQKVQQGDLCIQDVDEVCLSQHMMTSHLPEPDLLIRTSGEVRLSNFMLWQLAYTEFWFTDILWPDFEEDAFLDAVQGYQKRNRRYGGLKGEETN